MDQKNLYEEIERLNIKVARLEGQLKVLLALTTIQTTALMSLAIALITHLI